MTTRTRETDVTFHHPFQISTEDAPLPAGTYRLVVDEEAMPGLSFLAYRRTGIFLRTPAVDADQAHGSSRAITQDALDAALLRDRNTHN